MPTAAEAVLGRPRISEAFPFRAGKHVVLVGRKSFDSKGRDRPWNTQAQSPQTCARQLLSIGTARGDMISSMERPKRPLRPFRPTWSQFTTTTPSSTPWVLFTTTTGRAVMTSLGLKSASGTRRSWPQKLSTVALSRRRRIFTSFGGPAPRLKSAVPAPTAPRRGMNIRGPVGENHFRRRRHLLGERSSGANGCTPTTTSAVLCLRRSPRAGSASRPTRLSKPSPW